LLLTACGAASWKGRGEMALVTGLSTCSECFEWLVPGRLF